MDCQYPRLRVNQAFLDLVPFILGVLYASMVLHDLLKDGLAPVLIQRQGF